MKRFFYFLFLFIPILNALAASDNSSYDTDNIEPPPAAPIDEYVYVLFFFGIGLMLYNFYKTKKDNAFDKA